MNPSKILITTDLSRYSLAALEYILGFGLFEGAQLYLLHVLDLPRSRVATSSEDVDTRASLHRAEQLGMKRLEDFVAKHIGSDLPLRLIVKVGTPVDEIRHFAEAEGVDLIVVATHGWTGLRHIVMGSVAERVVRNSAIPVLTVKPHALRESILQREDIENELHLR
jgi:universal stress protein A